MSDDDKSEDEFEAHLFKRTKISQSKEFQKYIQHPLPSSRVDLLQFWKSQEHELPHLSKMARDYLAVQSSSVSTERDFSTGADLITPTRCSLKPNTIRTCMCVKSWYKLENFGLCKIFFYH